MFGGSLPLLRRPPGFRVAGILRSSNHDHPAIVVLGGMGSLMGIAVAAQVMIGGTEILRVSLIS